MSTAFLDANVLFSAAYNSGSSLLRLWELPGVNLATSFYAYGEAQVNLQESGDDESEQRLTRLTGLCGSVSMVYTISTSAEWTLPAGLNLPEKDIPIFFGAVNCQANFLLTGDKRHFGPYFGQTFLGVLITRPTNFLRSHTTATVTII
jgi:hypothetical protein